MLVQIGRMNERIDSLTQQMNQLTAAIADRQQADAQAYVTGQGVSKVNEGEREVTGLEIDGKQEASDALGEDTGAESGDLTESTRRVYLTFDDGPSCYTEDILDILDRYDVKATFFVVGKENDTAKELVREIADRGHTLGMHSYSHVYSDIYGSEEQFEADLNKIREYVYNAAGVTCTLYRFPGGSSNSVSRIDMEVFARCLDKQGIRFFDWNATSGDAVADMPSVDQIVKNVMSDMEGYSTVVVLMHDAADKRTTVEALPIIIESILALEDTAILPITEDTEPVQHIRKK